MVLGDKMAHIKSHTSGLPTGKKKKSKWKMVAAGIGLATILGGLGGYGKKLGTTGSWFGDVVKGGKGLFSNIWSGSPSGQSTMYSSNVGSKFPSLDATAASNVGLSDGGGLSGFFKKTLSSGSGMLGLSSIITSLGGFLGGLFDKSDEFAEKSLQAKIDLGHRELDIKEALGEKGLEIERMKAEDNIVRTGLGSTYLGWSPKQADRPGVFEGTPGLTVAQPTSGGMISPPKQGLIKQVDQGQIA